MADSPVQTIRLIARPGDSAGRLACRSPAANSAMRRSCRDARAKSTRPIRRVPNRSSVRDLAPAAIPDANPPAVRTSCDGYRCPPSGRRCRGRSVSQRCGDQRSGVCRWPDMAGRSAMRASFGTRSTAAVIGSSKPPASLVDCTRCNSSMPKTAGPPAADRCPTRISPTRRPAAHARRRRALGAGRQAPAAGAAANSILFAHPRLRDRASVRLVSLRPFLHRRRRPAMVAAADRRRGRLHQPAIERRWPRRPRALAMAAWRSCATGDIQPAICPPLGLASVRQMQFSGPAVGWLVGDGGLVLGTARPTVARRMATALPMAHPLVKAARRFVGTFDFSAVAVRGLASVDCRIAGQSRVSFGGRRPDRWTAGDTDQTVPISAITFVDDLHGWCGGAFGHDRGHRRWRPNLASATDRRGADRADGRLQRAAGSAARTVCPRIGGRRVSERRRSDQSPRCRNASAGIVSLPDRMQEASGVAGRGPDANSRGNFRCGSRASICRAADTTTIWDQAVEGDGVAELDAYLVRQIRIWRPSVVVTADRDEPASTADGLLKQAIVEAVRHAADPDVRQTHCTLDGSADVCGSSRRGTSGRSCQQFATLRRGWGNRWPN